MNRLFISRTLMLISFAVLYPCFSYADINDDLRMAIVNSNIEAVKFYLENGADVNKIYDDASTPLLEAIDKSSGSSDIVNLLLQYGANPKLKPSGVSPLSSAKLTNNEALVKLLRNFAEGDGEFYDLAVFYRDRNEPGSALEYADKAVKLNPLNSEAWELKGSIYLVQKKIKEAGVAYHYAFKASLENLKTNKSAEGYTFAVWYALLSDNFNDAVRIGREGLSLFPGNGSIALNTGHALLFLGNKKEAMTYYKKGADDLRQSDKYGDQAAQLFTDDFSLLEDRYPDKTATIEWAKKRLFEPFDFAYGEIPFGEEKDSVLKSAEGAAVKYDESAVIGLDDPVLKKQFGDGLYSVDLKTRLSPTVVEKYSLTYDRWDLIEHIDLFFTAVPGQGGQRVLFLVSKIFKEQRGKLDVLFGAMQDAVSKEIGIQPVVHTTQIISSIESIPVPGKIAVWKLTDSTVVLDVVDASSSSVQTRIMYVSKKGWDQYLNSLHSNKP